MQNGYDLVIFDLDGTLIDNREAIRANFKAALRQMDLPEVHTDLIDRTIGMPLVNGFKAVSPGISDETALRLVETYRAGYTDTSHIGVVLLDGVPEVLEKLRARGIKLALATTKHHAEVDKLLSRIGLLEYFDMTIGGYMHGLRLKPAPDMLNCIMETLDVKPNRAVMVGDTELDVLAGRNAGVFTIGVLTGVRLGIASEEKLRRAEPDVIIESLIGLEKFVGARVRR